MATIDMTSCEVGGAVFRANHVSVFSRPAGWIRIEDPEFGDWFHDMRSPACLEMLAMRLDRIVATAAAPAKTRRRRTSGA